MTNWNSAWGEAEKYAYRQGIKKGQKLKEEEIIRDLDHLGYTAAARAVATGEAPDDTHYAELRERIARLEERFAAASTSTVPADPITRIRDAIIDWYHPIDKDIHQMGDLLFSELEKANLINPVWKTYRLK